jgi:ArsR family transcriptional regulator, arsenate/arsenite/antimonite-responsive transcriptional repressor
MNPPNILGTSADAKAARFGALADPARVAIVERLRASERCACDLGPDLGLGPSLLSYHLRVLREAGLVDRRRRGRRVEYRLAAKGVGALLDDVRAIGSGVAV